MAGLQPARLRAGAGRLVVRAGAAARGRRLLGGGGRPLAALGRCGRCARARVIAQRLRHHRHLELQALPQRRTGDRLELLG